MDNLESLLDKNGMSQNDLARDLGLAPQTISSWKTRGTIPAADMAIRIAEKLNVSVEYLVTGKKPPSQDVLAIANEIARLPAVYQKIIMQNVEAYLALCFKQENAASQDTG